MQKISQKTGFISATFQRCITNGGFRMSPLSLDFLCWAISTNRTIVEREFDILTHAPSTIICRYKASIMP